MTGIKTYGEDGAQRSKVKVTGANEGLAPAPHRGQSKVESQPQSLISINVPLPGATLLPLYSEQEPSQSLRDPGILLRRRRDPESHQQRNTHRKYLSAETASQRWAVPLRGKGQESQKDIGSRTQQRNLSESTAQPSA